MNERGTVAAKAGWFAVHRSRAFQVVGGLGLYTAVNWLIDEVVYVYVIYCLGIFRGGLVMTTYSLLACLATLLLYQRMRIDWLGAGSLARMLTVDRPNWWQRVVIVSVRHGSVPAFFALCIFQDPFVTTAYFLRGQFGKLKPRDWQIFFASVIVSNGYWSLRSGAVVSVLTAAWEKLA